MIGANAHCFVLRPEGFQQSSPYRAEQESDDLSLCHQSFCGGEDHTGLQQRTLQEITQTLSCFLGLPAHRLFVFHFFQPGGEEENDAYTFSGAARSWFQNRLHVQAGAR